MLLTEIDFGTRDMTFNVVLDKPSTRDISVNWIASSEIGNEAVRGSGLCSYELIRILGLQEFLLVLDQQLSDVPIAGDTTYERNKNNTFTVTLSNPTGGAGIG